MCGFSAMEEKLIQRLESAVARLEAVSTGFRPGGSPETGDGAPVDPSILAFDDMMEQYLGRVSAAAEKIGGNVLEATKVVQKAFAVQKELLIKVKQTKVGNFLILWDFGFVSLAVFIYCLYGAALKVSVYEMRIIQ